MAQLPKTAALPPTAPTASVGRAAVGTRVAAVNPNPIEESNGSLALSLDAAAAGFQDQPRFEDALRREGGDQRRGQAFSYGRLFTADSAVFAAILERPNEAQDELVRRPVGEGSTVGRAINTYETNAKVITGSNPLTGTEFSISL